MNKKGQITIPKDVRDFAKLFPGMKCEVTCNDGKHIVITPYNYKCSECGASIPEGTTSSYCEKCQKSRSGRIY